AGERDHGALGAAAGGARQVKRGSLGIAARQDEILERRKRGLIVVDLVLECFHATGVERRAPLCGIRRGQLGADREQVALDRLHRVGFECRSERGRKTDRRVGFIHVAVGADPRVVLGHAGAAEQSRFAVVAGLRVDLHRLTPWPPLPNGERGTCGTYAQGQRSASGCAATTRRFAGSTAVARDCRPDTSAISSMRSSMPPCGPATTPRTEYLTPCPPFREAARGDAISPRKRKRRGRTTQRSSRSARSVTATPVTSMVSPAAVATRARNPMA